MGEGLLVQCFGGLLWIGEDDKCVELLVFFVSADRDGGNGSEFGEDFSEVTLGLAVGDLRGGGSTEGSRLLT